MKLFYRYNISFYLKQGKMKKEKLFKPHELISKKEEILQMIVSLRHAIGIVKTRH